MSNRDDKPNSSSLTRRERQIMDIIYRQGEATVQDVLNGLPDPPSYSAVRGLLRVLTEKGHLSHREDGPRYLYAPTHSRHSAAQGALRQVVQTFFGGSVTQTVATLLSERETRLSDDEIARLAALIEEARQQALPADTINPDEPRPNVSIINREVLS